MLEECNTKDEEDDIQIVSGDTCISPPGDGNNSEEDDVNEDIQEPLSASNLSGRQSRSRAPSQMQQSVPKPITPTPTKRQKVAVDVCLSGVDHHLESMPKQRHRSHCGKKANLICKACNVPLHRKGSAEFHV
ncbi:hypothetical protein ElyMa_000439900 [Elysia marginata]|uniref:PiggyBac transposable element-derived protein 4 C-terminal zinc-ribbon domain-containing protein n=1 Tax=Elysia marginata TaxID=1093978 RepID=A0AAV4FNF6_9GAST|nr:hypothetical protein ElyMa_000439900 [Elysia marginata]